MSVYSRFARLRKSEPRAFSRYQTMDQRLQTFEDRPSKRSVSKEDLASQGFIYDPCVISDTRENFSDTIFNCVRCVFCNAHISIWNMDKVDVRVRHRQLCPACPFVFDWNMNKEEIVRLSHRRFGRACPFEFEFLDYELCDRYLEIEFEKQYERDNYGIVETESDQDVHSSDDNQKYSNKSVESLQTKDDQKYDEYDNYSDLDELLMAKIDKTCTRTRYKSYQKQTEKQRKKAENRLKKKRRTKIRNAKRDQKQTYYQDRIDDDNYIPQKGSNDQDVKKHDRKMCWVCRTNDAGDILEEQVFESYEQFYQKQKYYRGEIDDDNHIFQKGSNDQDAEIHDRKMCWVCRSRDIDDMIEDQFLQSYERFLEEKYKEEFDNCFADEIDGVDDEEQNKIEHLPYVQSPYDYLIDKKLDEEAHHIYFSDYEAFAQYIETRDEEADHIYFSDDDASDAAFE
ncbi:hypothetical protein DPMN_038361 [Dreissena polymorpha]|uniref:Uncharacterized protein n=1 Tax=Dreissena polymorpha TaxID=45954 RepID=A0A9D4RNK8_DREPO|nr:hypothetical protein DPMN_038361 [Dreissena polymorpha]